MTSGVRAPAVAGKFYPSRAEELLRDVRKFTSTYKTEVETGHIAAIGCVAPHAGYIYSGGVAGAGHPRPGNPPPRRIFGPNPPGKGGRPAPLRASTWQAPLREVRAGRASGARTL